MNIYLNIQPKNKTTRNSLYILCKQWLSEIKNELDVVFF
jgi:hypothetical protein